MYRPPVKKPPTKFDLLLSRLTMAVDRLVFPTTCPICDRFRAGPPICEGCREELLEAAGTPCPRCAMPVGPYANLIDGCGWCRHRATGFDAAIALGPYQGPIRGLCLRMKHESDAWLARWLAEIWVESRGEALVRALMEDDPLPPVITSIPQHWSKYLGKAFYNQAEILALEFAKALRLKHRRLLKRVKPTPKLADLPRTARLEEMKGAFIASPRHVRGRQILLVDDILTSGATCGAAARALKKAGAKRVIAVVIGRSEGSK